MFLLELKKNNIPHKRCVVDDINKNVDSLQYKNGSLRTFLMHFLKKNRLEPQPHQALNSSQDYPIEYIKMVVCCKGLVQTIVDINFRIFILYGISI